MIWHIALFASLAYALPKGAPSPENLELYAEWVCGHESAAKKTGEHVSFHSPRLVRVKGFCKSGKPEGKWTHWDTKGVKLIEGNFKNGRTDGQFLYLLGKDRNSPDKNVYLKKEFIGGEMDDAATVEARAGKDEQGRKHGLFIHSVNGKVIAKEQYSHGAKVYEWHDGPKLFQEGALTNGKKQGIWSFRYPTGRLKMRGRYQADQMEGKWAFFDSQGKPSEEITYHNGVREGEARYYLAHGETLTGRYIKGTKVGTWVKRNDQGKVLEKLAYVNGKLKKPERVIAHDNKKSKPSRKNKTAKKNS